MEKRDLYNSNRQLTGETIYKGEPIPKDKYILVVLSFIKNSKDEFLVQKRSIEKNGKYGFTSGHAKAGETSTQAMTTEINEELGITIDENELELLYSGVEEDKQRFFDLYYLEKDFDINNLTLQEEEVDFVEWDSIDRIKKLMNNGLFSSSHKKAFYQVLNKLKEKSDQER